MWPDEVARRFVKTLLQSSRSYRRTFLVGLDTSALRASQYEHLFADRFL